MIIPIRFEILVIYIRSIGLSNKSFRHLLKRLTRRCKFCMKGSTQLLIPLVWMDFRFSIEAEIALS